jgi:hypothetical protein
MEFLFGWCRARIPSVIAVVFVGATFLPSAVAAADGEGGEHPGYLEIKQRLARGWNTWNNRSVLSYSLLPEGLSVNLAFEQVKWLDEPYLRDVLFGRDGDDAHIRPGPHTLDGSYTRLDIQWQQLCARIESAHAGDDLVVSSALCEPRGEPRVRPLLLLGCPARYHAFVESSEMPVPEEPLVRHEPEVEDR